MRINSLVFVLGFVLVAMAGLVGADFVVEENGTLIGTNYIGGDNVDGKINISFDKQENDMFESNFQGGISLLNLLKEMNYTKGKDYTCAPLSCMDSYIEEGSSSESLGPHQLDGARNYGFKIISNNFKEVNDFKLSITSDKGESCANPLFVDLLNDGVQDLINNKFVDSVCEPKIKGISGEATGNVEIGDDYYCQKMRLPPAPGYKIGGMIKEGSVKGDLEMSLWNYSQGDIKFLEDCVLDKSRDFTSSISGAQEVGCNAEYGSLKAFDSLVCVRSENGIADGYEIGFVERENASGGIKQGNLIEFIADYDLHANPLKYDGVGMIELTGEKYVELVNKYIKDVYNSDCSNGCIIPFRIQGNEQSITINSGEIEYKAGVGAGSQKKMSQVISDKFTISSGYLILNIKKMGFVVPNEDGEQTFRLSLNGEEILEEEIDVEVGFDFSIAPRFALIGQKTTFVANSDKKIGSSSWKFGDGSFVVNSDSERAQHTYTKEGEFIIEVTVRSGGNLSANVNGSSSVKKFNVMVGDAKRSANLTINRYEARLKNIDKDLKELPSWISEEASTLIELLKLKSSVEGAKNDFNLKGDNTKSEEYVDMINELLKLNVPISIMPSFSGELPGEIEYNNIDPGLIAELSGEDISDEVETRNSIIDWMDNNYGFDIEFETITALTDIGSVDVLTRYNIKTKPRSSDAGFPYLIIDAPLRDLKFNGVRAEDIGEGKGVYIALDDSISKNYEFIIIGEAPEIEELGIYISPVLGELGTSGLPYGGFYDEEGNIRWGRLLIGLGLLLVGFLIFYIILQELYKRRYEGYLFKNPDDLYNIINFIYNSRRFGMKDIDIKEKLKGKKWSGEQITYAFKKIDGKRTGMWEIPLFKFAENKKVKNEIAKKQEGRPVDVRFIKRPAL